MLSSLYFKPLPFYRLFTDYTCLLLKEIFVIVSGRYELVSVKGFVCDLSF